ncbi:MAG: tetratricopeptide repeat protein [Armatimonadota bacterium]
MLEEAIRHFDGGAHGAAVALLRRVVEGQPDNADAQCYLAAAYYRLGRYNLAAGPARAYAAQRPGDPVAQYILGMVLHRQGQTRRARAALEAAAASDSQPTATHVEVQRLLGDAPGAMAAATVAARPRRPAWVVPVLSAGVILAAGAIVLAIFFPYKRGTEEPKPPPQPVTPSPTPAPQPSLRVVPAPAPKPRAVPTPPPAPTAQPQPPQPRAQPAPQATPSESPQPAPAAPAATPTTVCPTCGGLGVVPARPGEPGAMKCINPYCDHGKQRCPYHPPFCPVDYGDDCPLCDGTRFVGTCQICKGTGYVKWCPRCKGKRAVPLPIPSPPPSGSSPPTAPAP